MGRQLCKSNTCSIQLGLGATPSMQLKMAVMLEAAYLLVQTCRGHLLKNGRTLDKRLSRARANRSGRRKHCLCRARGVSLRRIITAMVVAITNEANRTSTMSSTTKGEYQNRHQVQRLKDILRTEARAVNSITVQVQQGIKALSARYELTDSKTSKCARTSKGLTKINFPIVSLNCVLRKKTFHSLLINSSFLSLILFSLCFCVELQIAGAASLQRERELTSQSELSQIA